MSVLDELSSRVMADTDLAARDLIPKPLPNTTSFRKDSQKETPLDECEPDESVLHVGIRCIVGVTCVEKGVVAAVFVRVNDPGAMGDTEETGGDSSRVS